MSYMAEQDFSMKNIAKEVTSKEGRLTATMREESLP
jgi:hypothetical protein